MQRRRSAYSRGLPLLFSCSSFPFSFSPPLVPLFPSPSSTFLPPLFQIPYDETCQHLESSSENLVADLRVGAVRCRALACSTVTEGLSFLPSFFDWKNTKACSRSARYTSLSRAAHWLISIVPSLSHHSQSSTGSSALPCMLKHKSAS